MILYTIDKDEFEKDEESDFSASADAEPLLWEMEINQDLFWDEIDWLWDSTDECGEGWCS